MKNILLLGAGKSSTSLIDYLIQISQKEGWNLKVGDSNLSLVKNKFGEEVDCFETDVTDSTHRNQEIAKADLVISMMPTRYHILIAQSCLMFKKHLVTASYLSDDMRALNDEAKKTGLIFLNECGLDPGIDHMSAMKLIDKIREEGNQLIGFESFTGGLLAGDTDDNPWQYKFTWNPRNVVLAGQGVVKFIQQGLYKFIPYHKLFQRTEIINIPGYGYFEGYANRDSLKYLDVYNLRGIQTLFRGTLRRPGFCKAWDVFVQLGTTDDTYVIEEAGSMTHRQFLNAFLSYNPNDSVELKLAHYLKLELSSEVMHKISWLGLFEDTLVGLEKGTPAQILEHILKKKWTLDKKDKDMIVMWHKFNYLDQSGNEKEIHSTMVSLGKDYEHTAMSKSVGLPMGIASKLILKDKIKARGTITPTIPEIYNPILAELKTLGFELIEKKIEKT